MVYQPYMTQEMMAKECGVARETLCRWRSGNDEFKEALDKATKERWKAAEQMAVTAMINLASEGNIQAVKYMLDNLGYKAEDKTKLTMEGSLDININIEE